MIIKDTKCLNIRPLYLLFVLPVFLLPACKNKSREYQSPPSYNLNSPQIIKLPSELADVSGITYYAKSNSLFAESDEKGNLYKISLSKTTDIKKWKISHKKDYEDVVLVDSTFYVLNNNGDIVAINFTSDSAVSHEYKFPGTGKSEFESLYYDDQVKKLVLICKDCDADKANTTTTYAFDLQQQTYTAYFTMDITKVNELISPMAAKFKPSAAAINPATNELYIISSVNKLLVVADRTGVVKNVYRLNPKVFNQPEGIAFMPSGDMFISNEAGDIQPANILFYPFKKEAKK